MIQKLFLGEWKEANKPESFFSFTIPQSSIDYSRKVKWFEIAEARVTSQNFDFWHESELLPSNILNSSQDLGGEFRIEARNYTYSILKFYLYIYPEEAPIGPNLIFDSFYILTAIPDGRKIQTSIDAKTWSVLNSPINIEFKSSMDIIYVRRVEYFFSKPKEIACQSEERRITCPWQFYNGEFRIDYLKSFTTKRLVVIGYQKLFPPVDSAFSVTISANKNVVATSKNRNPLPILNFNTSSPDPITIDYQVFENTLWVFSRFWSYSPPRAPKGHPLAKQPVNLSLKKLSEDTRVDFNQTTDGQYKLEWKSSTMNFIHYGFAQIISNDCIKCTAVCVTNLQHQLLYYQPRTIEHKSWNFSPFATKNATGIFWSKDLTKEVLRHFSFSQRLQLAKVCKLWHSIAQELCQKEEDSWGVRVMSRGHHTVIELCDPKYCDENSLLSGSEVGTMEHVFIYADTRIEMYT